MSLKKITFIGDITCDRPLLNASKVSDKGYNFDKVFKETKDLFAKSDFVVGNLETVFGGADKGYNAEYMLLNTPDALADSMKKAGINCATTANNHCMDQGIEGVKRTLDILDDIGIEFTGTYRNIKDYEDIFVKDIGGYKIAIVAGTFSINSENIDQVLNEKNHYYVDLFKDVKIEFASGLKGFLKKTAFAIIPPKYRRSINRYRARKKLSKGKQFLTARVDEKSRGDFDNFYFNQWMKKIDRAKELADIVFVCPHFGGQFNDKPGEYSKELMSILLNKGVHVVGNHPHVIQKIISSDSFIGAYSLGGFNQSVSGDYIDHNAYPEYSLALHFYIEDSKVSKSTYTILKNVEYSDGSLTVYPIDKLVEELDEDERKKLDNEVLKIFNRVNDSSEDAVDSYGEFTIR